MKKGADIKEWVKGGFFVVLMGVGLVVLLSMVMGRPPVGKGAEREVYKTVGGKELALWVYKPKRLKEGTRHPCVVWFFGGGWKVGSPGQFAAQSKVLAKRGVVAVAAEYRVESRHGGTPVESTMDARSAVRWLRIHADDLGIDSERVAVGGGSSGGQLALACEMVADVNDPTDKISVSPEPNALVLFNPVVNMDIPLIRKETSEEELAELMKISPMQNLSRKLPPTIIFQGTEDLIVPADSVVAFVERARSIGSETIHYHSYPGRTHEFYVYGPDSRRDYKDTLEKVLDFLGGLGWL